MSGTSNRRRQLVEGTIESAKWQNKCQTLEISTRENGKPKTVFVRSIIIMKVMPGDAIVGEMDTSTLYWCDTNKVQVEAFANRAGMLNCLKKVFGLENSGSK